MGNNHFNVDKSKAVLLYIAKQLGKVDLHKLFKILYFAEKKHLSIYGRLIVNDTYFAMKNGPVPSYIYDILKAIKGQGLVLKEVHDSFSAAFEYLDNNTIIAKEDPNMDYLSQSAISCLTESIFENKDLCFNTLSDKSHDIAWNNPRPDNSMDMYKIALAADANIEMLKYISEVEENRNLEFV
ncbi:MAG: SocA family protein [Bacteroidales bacterium]|nr:SocA family protein [Bacteroidales bacterium]